MAVKKVLAAVGLVCIVAPAALAMMNSSSARGSGSPGSQVAVSNIVQQFAALWKNNEQEESRLPAHAGPGTSNLPFRLAHVIDQRLANSAWLKLPGQEPGEPATSGAGMGAVGPIGGPIGQTETRQDTNRLAAMSTNGGHGARNASFSGVGGVGSGGRGSGGGSGGGGSAGGASGSGGSGLDGVPAGSVDQPEGLTQVLPELLRELEEQHAAPPAGVLADAPSDRPVAVIPLPASVWMLLASFAGLITLRIRGRAGHV
jgi:hypothetical protein